MVKNTTGGSKSKGFARKNMIKQVTQLRTAEEGEIYAQAIKIMGGSICRVMDLNGNEMTCHIRGKFRGRGKRDNFIGSGTWLLVGLRHWEGAELAAGKLKECDLVEVYSDAEKSRLRNTELNVDWSKFVANDNKIISAHSASDANQDNEVEFTDQSVAEYEELINSQLAVNNGKNTIITTDDGEEIDVDDI